MDGLIRVRIESPAHLEEWVVGQAFQWGAQGVEVCDQTTHDIEPGLVWIHVWHPAAVAEDIQRKYADMLPQTLTVTSTLADMAWTRQLEDTPREIGTQFLLNGGERPQASRINIELQPGLGFGAGEHPTTRACVDALEELFRHKPTISRTADIGTGTGILAIVAAHLGASVWATDIEDIARQAAHENCVLNGLADKITVVRHIPESLGFQLVIANLYAGALLSMGERLFRWTEPGGHCLISGITQNAQDQMMGTYQAIGFQSQWVHDCGEWVAITLKRPKD